MMVSKVSCLHPEICIPWLMGFKIAIYHYNVINCIISFQMNNPCIQNDFSYFRRTMSRRGTNNAAISGINFDDGKFISTEMANEMSLFYAEATPMLTAIASSTTRFVQEVSGLLSHSESLHLLFVFIHSVLQCPLSGGGKRWRYLTI